MTAAAHPTGPAPQADAEPPFVWTDAFLLGYGPMDDTHREFVEVVHAMQQAADADLLAALDAFIAHAQAHFGSEDRWMEDTGFPPRDCHIKEHAAVLASAEAVRQTLIDNADVDNCRGFIDALIDWFPGHADHLDSALSHWMCKQRMGGKPVVLRRDLGPSTAPEPPPRTAPTA